MLSTTVVVDDIKRIPAIWNIALADMIYMNKILMKDDKNSADLTKRILDMRHVANNPGDFFKLTKENKKDDFTLIAKGWVNIVKYINDPQCIFSEFMPEADDIDQIYNYIGKKYQNNLAKGYLRRMNLEEKEFKLYQHKKIKTVFVFSEMKSKYKAANKYNITLSFEQINLWNKSLKQYKLNKSLNKYTNYKLLDFCKKFNIKINKKTFNHESLKNKLFNHKSLKIDCNDKHWINYLNDNKKNNVSTYLHIKYQERDIKLTKIREENVKTRKLLWCDGVNIGAMNKDKLLIYADELKIEYPAKILKKHLLLLMLKHFNKNEEIINVAEIFDYYEHKDDEDNKDNDDNDDNDDDEEEEEDDDDEEEDADADAIEYDYNDITEEIIAKIAYDNNIISSNNFKNIAKDDLIEFVSNNKNIKTFNKNRNIKWMLIDILQKLNIIKDKKKKKKKKTTTI